MGVHSALPLPGERFCHPCSLSLPQLNLTSRWKQKSRFRNSAKPAASGFPAARPTRGGTVQPRLTEKGDECGRGEQGPVPLRCTCSRHRHAAPVGSEGPAPRRAATRTSASLIQREGIREAGGGAYEALALAQSHPRRHADVPGRPQAGPSPRSTGCAATAPCACALRAAPRCACAPAPPRFPRQRGRAATRAAGAYRLPGLEGGSQRPAGELHRGGQRPGGKRPQPAGRDTARGERHSRPPAAPGPAPRRGLPAPPGTGPPRLPHAANRGAGR